MSIEVEEVVNEGSTATLNAVVRDASGNAIVPTAMSYTIHDVASGTTVLEETIIGSPSLNNNIPLSSLHNTLVDATNAYERRRVTIKATTAGGGAQNSEYIYTIKRLRGLL